MLSALFRNSKNGFTLIEVLVAVILFSLLAGAILNFLVFGISSQRNSLGRQLLVDQTSFFAEYMSRALRQAQKDTTGGCIDSGSNYRSAAPDEIEFLDGDGICRRIFLDTSGDYGIIKEVKGATADLTSDDLDVLGLTFQLRGADQTDDLQPRATFSIHARARGADPEIFFQTTISQRHLDVQE